MDLGNLVPPRIMTALLLDADTFGSANNPLQLSQTPFNPKTGVGFTPCNFTGAGNVTAPEFINGVDPVTLDPTLTLVPPSGGFKWTTADGANLPQNVWGYRVLNPSTNEPLGGQVFAQAIVLNAAGQTFTLEYPKLRMRPEFLG